MEVASAPQPAAATSERLETVRSAFQRGEQSYATMASPLYSALCAAGAGDPEIVALAANAQHGAQPAFHLMASVHSLLLNDPSDPLARFYATLSDAPAPPQQAFTDFARYCREHCDEILHLLRTRTVQTTYVERCGTLMPLLSAVADRAGEPLNLIEIGCSAGIMLAFDKYAYDIKGRGIIGAPDAPVTIKCDIRGGPPLHVPRIGTRTGLDLHTIDVRDQDQTQWLIALTFPEHRAERANLIKALDVVAATGLRLFEGDALDNIETALAETPDPVCVYHSACLFYWPDEARAALEEKLKAASRGREIYRAGIEPSAAFGSWHRGFQTGSGRQQAAPRNPSEPIIARYKDGVVESAIVARASYSAPFEWIEDRA